MWFSIMLSMIPTAAVRSATLSSCLPRSVSLPAFMTRSMISASGSSRTPLDIRSEPIAMAIEYCSTEASTLPRPSRASAARERSSMRLLSDHGSKPPRMSSPLRMKGSESSGCSESMRFSETEMHILTMLRRS